MKINASAPGKLMLFGEHAVVYNRPCIVTAVSSRIYVSVEKTSGRFLIDAPQVKDLRFVEETVKMFKNRYQVGNGLTIQTHSDFSHQYGFGSSSAVTVALISALAKTYQLYLSKKEIFNLGYKIALEVQGVGSGFDIAAATFGGVLYFVTGGKEIKPIKTEKSLPLVVGYSGVKADTPKIVKRLKLKIKSQRSKSQLTIQKIFNLIEKIVLAAKLEITNRNWKKLGELMNENHRLLQKLDVSTKKLDKMCQAALKAGAYGAKLSGAGGGDCMIALVEDNKREDVKKAIESVGGQIIKVNNNAEGVVILNDD